MARTDTDPPLADATDTMASSRTTMARLPIYPAALVGAFVINVFHAFTAPAHALSRPLVATMILVFLIQAVLSVLLRDRHHGALLTLVVLLVVGDALPAALFLLISWLAASLFAMTRTTDRIAIAWPKLTETLNIVGAITLALAIGSSVLAADFPRPMRDEPGPEIAAAADAPDIFVLLLDAYPRADTLRTHFKIDNTPFLQRMSDLGFAEASDSHSNYNLTLLTLASMFNMTPISEVVPSPATGTTDQYRQLQRALNEADSLEILRRAGYEIVSVPSTSTTTALVQADQFLPTGAITDLELTLLQNGRIPRLLPDVQREVIGDSHREGLRIAFDLFGDLGRSELGRPRFALVHVMAPHAPYVLAPRGADQQPWPCFPTSCNIWQGEEWVFGLDAVRDALAFQLEAVNEMVATSAERLVQINRRPAVVIVMSDHGHRSDFTDGDEMLRNLFLARTPDRPKLFESDITPIAVLPTLLNAYLGTELPVPAPEYRLADLRDTTVARPLTLTPWDPGED